MTVNNLNENSLLLGNKKSTGGISSKEVTKRLYGQASQKKERLHLLEKQKNWGDMHKEFTFEPNADRRSRGNLLCLAEMHNLSCLPSTWSGSRPMSFCKSNIRQVLH